MTKLTVTHLAAFKAKLIKVENSSSESSKFEAARSVSFEDFRKTMSFEDALDKAYVTHAPKIEAFEKSRREVISTLKAAIVEASRQIEQARIDDIVLIALELI